MHGEHHYLMFDICFVQERCTRCTIFTVFGSRGGQNGIPRAPFFRFDRSETAEMVPSVHHFRRLQLGFWEKRCIGCTNSAGFSQGLPQNGAPGAPIRPVSVRDYLKMVHQMHQLDHFPSGLASDWCTSCTDLAGFRQVLHQNGALPEPSTNLLSRATTCSLEYNPAACPECMDGGDESR